MNVSFDGPAIDEYNEWAQTNQKIFAKLVNLVKSIRRDPFNGLGKPEPLKHDQSGLWSRHITDKHRLIYKIENDIVIIKSCKGHYDDK
jgi:toxin YoeB